MIADAAAHPPETAVPRPLLLSLRPRFADAILDGSKTVELRRTRMTAPDGTLLILYSSTPVMAVVGTATLAGRETDTANHIWHRHRRNLGLTKAEFDAYLLGASQATAIAIASPQRLANPPTLSALRAQTNFRPPQSFRYLSEQDPEQLRDLVTTSVTPLGRGHRRVIGAEPPTHVKDQYRTTFRHP